MDFVFVCKENLPGDLAEGFFSSGVKERLRLLVGTAIIRGCGLQECGCSTGFLLIVYGKDLPSDVTVVLDNMAALGHGLAERLNPQVGSRGGEAPSHALGANLA